VRAIVFSQDEALSPDLVRIHLRASLREIGRLRVEKRFRVSISRPENGATAAIEHFLSIHKLDIEV